MIVSNIQKGVVNPDSVRQLTLTVENEEDANLLDHLRYVFKHPESRSEAQRLALCVLANQRELTLLAMLVDEATQLLQDRDAKRSFVSRAQLLEELKTCLTGLEHCDVAAGYARILGPQWAERVAKSLVEKGWQTYREAGGKMPDEKEKVTT